MRPSNPVACRITIGAPSPPQSRTCSRTRLTFTKLEVGSSRFEAVSPVSIFSMSSAWRFSSGFSGCVLLDRGHRRLDGFRFGGADVFERDRLEQAVARGVQPGQHAADAWVGVARAA